MPLSPMQMQRCSFTQTFMRNSITINFMFVGALMVVLVDSVAIPYVEMSAIYRVYKIG